MATWEEISAEVAASDPDTVRRKKLKKINELTGRPVILYATEMFNQVKVSQSPSGSEGISINLNDITGFNEVLRDISGDKVDVILHSPGGSPEATESIVKLLRRRFTSVRFIIPSIAKSAATMMTMSGNEIILGDNAELGPTDPQMIINGKLSPAHSIIDQFKTATDELTKNNKSLPAWLPILEQYGPSLLSQCKDAIKLSERLVNDWLKRYMFNGNRRDTNRARRIATYLASNRHLSHGRAIDIERLKRGGVKIKFANEVSGQFATALQDLDLALQLTFERTGAIKIFENHLGKGLYYSVQFMVINPQQLPMQLQPPGTPQE